MCTMCKYSQQIVRVQSIPTIGRDLFSLFLIQMKYLEVGYFIHTKKWIKNAGIFLSMKNVFYGNVQFSGIVYNVWHSMAIDYATKWRNSMIIVVFFEFIFAWARILFSLLFSFIVCRLSYVIGSWHHSLLSRNGTHNMYTCWTEHSSSHQFCFSPSTIDVCVTIMFRFMFYMPRCTLIEHRQNSIWETLVVCIIPMVFWIDEADKYFQTRKLFGWWVHLCSGCWIVEITT